MKTIKLNNLLITEGDAKIIGQYEADVNGIHVEIICKGSDLTEETASYLVDETAMWEKHQVKCYRYRSYRNGFVAFPTAIESFESLINSQGYHWGTNPLGENPCVEFNDSYQKDIDYDEWQELEQRTFKLDQTLIFRIVD